jgi:hypothetical protein
LVPLILQNLFPKNVSADFADHPDLGAQPGGHHGLIAAFAPEAKVKRLARERFRGFREARGSKGQIDIRGTEDTNPRPALRHDFTLRMIPTAPCFAAYFSSGKLGGV